MVPPAAHGVPYWKMNGIGNEIVVVDLRHDARQMTEDLARKIASNPLTTFDQLMVIEPPKNGGDAFMSIHNTDGSLAEACGNGTRCVADILMREKGKDQLDLATSAGPLSVWRATDDQISVDMGQPRFRWDEIPLSHPMPDTMAIDLEVGLADAPDLQSPSVVNMGNPHAIFWVENPELYGLQTIGPTLEHHSVFPDRANISLAHVKSKDEVDVKVWERGAGITRACGSAACATVVAGAKTGRTNRIAKVHLPGGVLLIDWRADTNHVIMTGSFEYETEGQFDVDLFPRSPRSERIG